MMEHTSHKGGCRDVVCGTKITSDLCAVPHDSIKILCEETISVEECSSNILMYVLNIWRCRCLREQSVRDIWIRMLINWWTIYYMLVLICSVEQTYIHVLGL